mmetsp:Transcript_20083/g.60123  ORF Transcript_20083/g.60123 Transcript_20083/m.60123 type:complete len:529 (-) Transcript_20083:254-1840(-)
MAERAADQRRVLFCFPAASGHLNPSLPLARCVVEAGHQAQYLCSEPMRGAIEDTGASFHAVESAMPELYSSRQADLIGAMGSLQEEHGVTDGFFITWQKFSAMHLELQLPGMLRVLQHWAPDVVVYDPVLCAYAAVGASLLKIPSVALLTFAGPGAREPEWRAFLEESRLSFGEADSELKHFEPHVAAVRRLKDAYGIDCPLGLRRPLGKLETLALSELTLVTTAEHLQNPLSREMAAAYQAEGARFEYVGALLDRPGARRAGTHKEHGPGTGPARENPTPASSRAPCPNDPSQDAVVASVAAARAAKRKVVLVSMGTIITGDTGAWCWHSRALDADGKPRGLTGREICHAAWAGTFDAFGADRAESGPLVVISVGPQKDPLGELAVPPNAICVPCVAQVDVLRAGVDVFLTHGGQNSMMEALSQGTPLVVCPGTGDQITNGGKAVRLGVGKNIDRPDPVLGSEMAAAHAYRNDVCKALQEVLSTPSYSEEAAGCARLLARTGGVPRAVDLVLGTAEGWHKAAGRGGA